MTYLLKARGCIRGLVIAGWMAAAAQAIPLNLVQNGGFESTAVAGDVRIGTNATYWSTTSYSFIYGSGTGQNTGNSGVPGFWPGVTNTMPASSPDGGNFIGADGAYFSGPISQTIYGLVAGQTYLVSFWQAGAQQMGYSGDTTDKFQVSLGTEMHDSALITNASHDFSPWTKQNLLFHATAASEVLSFLAVGTPDGVPPFTLLDGVSLSVATPEPAAVAITAAGLVGLAALRRRKR